MFKKAIRIDQNFSDAYANLTDLYNTYYNTIAKPEEKEKYLKLQEAYLDTALSLDPNSSEVHVAKCWLHQAKGEILDGLKSAKRAVALDKNNNRSYFALSSMYSYLGLNDIALECLAISQMLDPLNLMTFIERGINLSRGGYYQEAASHYEQFIRLYPERIWSCRDYALVLIYLNNFDKAEEMLNKFSEVKSDSIGQRIYLQYKVILYAAEGEKEKALELLNEKIAAEWVKMIVYGYLGMETEFFASFLKVYDLEPEITSLYIRFINYPYYDKFRSHPRFQEILAKHKKLYDENMAKYGDIDL
jgi:tetratricopeptide (TPR) repeat protein